MHATNNDNCRRRYQLLVALLLCVFGGAYCYRVPTARAAEPLVQGNTNCPDPMAVQAEVFRLTSAERRARYLPGARVLVVDSGDQYQVEVEKAGERFKKTYSDPARECDRRVRFAAVYVVMTLMPPDFGDERNTPATAVPSDSAGRSPESARPGDAAGLPPNETRDPPSEADFDASQRQAKGDAAPSESEGSDARWLELELGLTVAHSLSSSEAPRVRMFGGELGASVGAGMLAWATAVAIAPSTQFDLGDVRIDMFEASVRSGLRLRWQARHLGLAADAGVLIARRQLEAVDMLNARPERYTDVGAMLGVLIAYDWGQHWAPFAGFRTALHPASPDLTAAPRGSLGKMPHIWFSAIVGVRLNL